MYLLFIYCDTRSLFMDLKAGAEGEGTWRGESVSPRFTVIRFQWGLNIFI